MSNLCRFTACRPSAFGLRALAFLLAVVFWASSADAQVINPTTVSFLPSPDNNAVDSNGQPIVTSYSLEIFQLGASQPYTVLNLGKPAPGSDGYITVNFASMLSSPPLPGETLEGRVAAIGAGGTGDSTWSNTFMFGTPPAPPPPSPAPADAPEITLTGVSPRMGVQPDFDGDGFADLVWRNASLGINTLWFMNGATLSSWVVLPGAPSDWQIEAVADFDGDGRADLVWRNAATGRNTIWFMAAGTIASWTYLPSQPGLTWHMVGAGDFNGDGRPDLVWRNSATGATTVWYMDGARLLDWTIIADASAVTSAAWQIQAVADLDGDGNADLVWRNTQLGTSTVWFMHRAALASWQYLPTVTDGNWQIAAVGDYNADGHADLVWRNYATGQDTIWFMNGAVLVNWTQLLPGEPTGWAIIRRR